MGRRRVVGGTGAVRNAALCLNPVGSLLLMIGTLICVQFRAERGFSVGSILASCCATVAIVHRAWKPSSLILPVLVGRLRYLLLCLVVLRAHRVLILVWCLSLVGTQQLTHAISEIALRALCL